MFLFWPLGCLLSDLFPVLIFLCHCHGRLTLEGYCSQAFRSVGCQIDSACWRHWCAFGERSQGISLSLSEAAPRIMAVSPPGPQPQPGDPKLKKHQPSFCPPDQGRWRLPAFLTSGLPHSPYLSFTFSVTCVGNYI